MLVDMSACFAYKEALVQTELRIRRGPVIRLRPPLLIASLYQRKQCRSERDYVNTIVDAGSSSVRIQRITGGQMLRAGIRIKPTSATSLSSLVRPQKFFTHY